MRESAATGGEHPSDEEWEQLMCGELPEHRRAAVIEHLTACFICRDVYRALRFLELEAQRAGLDVPIRERQPSRVSAWLIGVAAAVTLIAFSWPMVRRAPVESPQSAYRSLGGTVIDVVGPDGRVRFPLPDFEWQPVDGARHRLRLERANGALVWESALVAGGVATLAPEVALEPGRYYWRVIAWRDGEIVAESALIELEIPRDR